MQSSATATIRQYYVAQCDLTLKPSVINPITRALMKTSIPASQAACQYTKHSYLPHDLEGKKTKTKSE